MEQNMSLHLLQAIVEGTPDCIAAFDASFTFVVANEACRAEFAKLYGRQLALGATLATLFADLPEQRERTEAVLSRGLVGETFRLRTEAGLVERLRRSYDVAVHPLRDASGLVYGVALIVRPTGETDSSLEKSELLRAAGSTMDTLDLREAERALAAAREELIAATISAQRAMQAKSQFFAAVSHDLRQPAQSLLLLSSLLKVRAAGTAVADLAEPLELAVGALKQLLDGVLDIARLDAGMVKAQEENVAVGEIIRRLAWEYGDRAYELGLVLRHVDSTAVVRTDPVLFERVLRQYLENALRFTPEGRILLGCRRRGGCISTEVLDTGIGIAEQDRRMIFEEFYQVGNIARDRALGLGLGLAVVRRLAEIMGAEVGVSSAPGRGSHFRITLPSGEETRPGLGEEPVWLTDFPKSGTALVIEDDGMIQGCLQLLLAHWGYRVVTASTGEQAEQLAVEGLRPSVVLADYRLDGGMNGMQAIEAIRGICGHGMPALVVTGAAETGLQHELDASGVAVLYKPVDMDSLRAELLRLVRLV